MGRRSGGFTIHRADHWTLKDTALVYGHFFGSASRIFGYEVDGFDYTVNDGVAKPTGTDGADPSVTIMGKGLASNVEIDQHVWGETYWIGKNDTRWIADLVYENYSPATMERVKRKNGVMIHWQHKKGEVFNAATCEWVNGLRQGDLQVEQVTRNVLNRFTMQDSE